MPLSAASRCRLRGIQVPVGYVPAPLLLVGVLFQAVVMSAAQQECQRVSTLAEVNSALQDGMLTGRFCVIEGYEYRV